MILITNAIIAHGSFIGSIRLESHKPTKLQINSTFHFGASTRRYILRERPSGARSGSIMEDIPMIESSDGTIHGLPENQTELDVNSCVCSLLNYHLIWQPQYSILEFNRV